MIRISYVMPCYDRAKVIVPAAESVLRQLQPDDELIVVDDGSRDETPAVLERLAKQWGEKLRLLRQENAGPGAARNRGMAAARGDWVGFLDSDDALFPGAVERWRAAIERFPHAGFLIAGRLDCYPDGNERRVVGRQVSSEPLQAMARFLIYERHHIGVGAILVRRDIAVACGFPPELAFAEDTAFCARVFACTKAAVIPELAYRYNVEPERVKTRTPWGDFDVVDLIDRIFDPKIVPPEAQSIKRQALAAAWLSVFREMHRRGHDAQAWSYYRRALGVAPRLALRPRYLRKALRGLIGWRHPEYRRASRA